MRRCGPCITRADRRVSAWVIPMDEDLMTARHVRAFLNPEGEPSKAEHGAHAIKEI